jgi:hypothetical protein
VAVIRLFNKKRRRRQSVATWVSGDMLATFKQHIHRTLDGVVAAAKVTTACFSSSSFIEAALIGTQPLFRLCNARAIV